MIQAALGLNVCAPDAVRFDKPSLPAFLSNLSLDGLTCGEASVDLDVQQIGPATSVFVRRAGKNVKVAIGI